MDVISVIIPSYNRFDTLINTIKSVQNQSYPNIEIIVVNDCSSESKYYNYSWNNVTIIHLPERSSKKFGYPCVGYVRNQGIKVSSGKYIAFCDDDDVWLPNKLNLQVALLKSTKCNLCCTEGLIGNGPYDETLINKYKKYNREYYWKTLKKIYSKTPFLNTNFPKIWGKKFLKIHNCVICSSVLVSKDILLKAGNMQFQRRGQDYKCWLTCIKYTDIAYLEIPCIYYDLKHGNGSNH